MKTTYYYCTCKKGGGGNGAEGFREVQADKEGTCLDCGHYVITLPKKAKNRSEMYSMLRIDKKEEVNHYIGESLVDSIKSKHQMYEEKKIKNNNKTL